MNSDFQALNQFDPAKNIYLEVIEENGEQKLVATERSWLGRGLKTLGFNNTESTKKLVEYLKNNPIITPKPSDLATVQEKLGRLKEILYTESNEEGKSYLQSIDQIIDSIRQQESSIEEAKALYQELKLAATASDPAISVPHLMQQRGLDPKTRYNVAMQMVNDKESPGILDCYQEFDFSTDELFELLKNELQCNFSEELGTYENREKSDLVEKLPQLPFSKTQKYELAKIIAANTGNKTLSKFIHLLDLTNTQNFEVAKIAAKNPQFFWYFDKFEFLSNFKLSVDQRFEIATLLISQDKFSVFENIDKFDFDFAHSYKLAQLATTRNVQESKESTKERRSTREEDEKCAETVFKHIQLFKLDDLSQKERYKFAMEAYWSPAAIKYIFSLNLDTDQEWEFAQALAHSGSCGVHIGKFKTLSLEQRFELAQLQANEKCVGGTSIHPKRHLQQRLYSFGTEDDGDLSRNIKDYQLTESQREALAKLIFIKEDSFGFQYYHLPYFNNYELSDESLKTTLLGNCFITNPDKCLPFLPEGFVADEATREKLIKKYARSSESQISLFLQLGFPKLSILKYLAERYRKKLLGDRRFRYPNSLRGNGEPITEERIVKDFAVIILLQHAEFNSQVKPAASLLQNIGEEHPLLKPVIEEIEAIENLWVQNLQFSWFAGALLLIKSNEASVDQLKVIMPILHQLAALRMPEMRVHLTSVLFKEKDVIHKDESFSGTLKKLFTSTIPGWFMSGPDWLTGKVGYPHADSELSFAEKCENLIKISSLLQNRPHTQVFKVALLPLFQAEDDWSIITTSLSSSEFKDSGRHRIALNCLKVLGECKQLRLSDKKRLLDSAFTVNEEQTNSEKIKTICANLQKIEAALQMEIYASLRNVSSMESVDKDLQEKLSEILGITDLPNIYENYTKLQQRYSNALVIYAGKLNHHKDIKAVFSTYVKAVLEDNGGNGRFHQLRREYDPGSHLDIVFKGRDELKQKWQMSETVPFLELVPPAKAALQAQGFDIHEYLKRRVCDDKHIDPEEFSHLANCLQNPASIAAIQDQLKNEQEALKDSMKEASVEVKKAGGKQLKKLQFQSAVIQLLDPKMPQDEKAEYLEKSILPVVPSLQLKDSPFKDDLEGLKAMLKPPKKESVFDKWTVNDTDDWQDLLLLGTEVIGSCQNINGASMNICLTNYIMDDKIRAVVVKNEKGSIIARAILRLLYDEKAEQPVLFKEYLYLNPEITFQNATAAIEAMCIKRAKTLNLTLTAAKDGSGKNEPYFNPLQSYSSKSAEYVDADRIGLTNGVYKLSANNLQILSKQEPKEKV